MQILSTLIGADGGTAARRHGGTAARRHGGTAARRVAGHDVAREPDAVRWYADYQPFTPVINTLRSLLCGTPAGNTAMLAVAWSIGLALVGYVLARRVYSRSAGR